MSTQRPDEEAGHGGQIPRDLPDQQAEPGEETPPGETAFPEREGEERELPDTDEAGSGPRGSPQTEYEHPDGPEPYEPPD